MKERRLPSSGNKCSGYAEDKRRMQIHLGQVHLLLRHQRLGGLLPLVVVKRVTGTTKNIFLHMGFHLQEIAIPL